MAENNDPFMAPQGGEPSPKNPYDNHGAPRNYGHATQNVMVTEEAIIDFHTLANVIGYVARSLLRHRRLLIISFVLVVSLTAVIAFLTPKVYKVSTRILTHKSVVMAALVHPERSIPQSADAPTSGAIELIKSRENLEKLMQEVNLQRNWEQKKPMISKLKERLLVLALGKISDNDLHEAYLKMLEERLSTSVQNDVVTMDIEWPDAEVAMDLAEGAIKRFLEMRRDMELSEFIETVRILERNVEQSRQRVDEAISQMQKIFNRKEADFHNRSSNAEALQKRRVLTFKKAVGPDRVDLAAEDLRRVLTEKQAAINILRHTYELKVKRAEEELANLRATLGPEHPDLLEAKRNAAALAQPPPELLALQEEENHLASQLGNKGQFGQKDKDEKLLIKDRDGAGEHSFEMVKVSVSDEVYQQLNADPEIVSIMTEIEKRQNGHEDLLRRLANARIESETASAAFVYRYKQTVPPVFPKKYIKPNIPAMLIAGSILGLLLGAVWALLRDVLSRRILESWQVQRFLGLKVLGEIDEP